MVVLRPQTLRWASLLGATAVLLGAFGAHGLKDHLDESAMKIYQTAVHYHFWHALALLAAGNISTSRWTSRFFIFGILVFSGSLYLLAITDIRWLGAITPLGGVSLILGWISLTLGFYNQDS